MGCASDVSRACSALLLIVINAVLLLGGILILYGGIHARHSGWLDVVDAHWSGAKTILTVLEVIGGVIIGLAVLGSIAACCRWRAGLLIYTFLIALVLVLFIVIAVFAFGVRSTANDWKNKTYPAANDETTIKTEFDRAYCYAQGAYICNDMAISDAAAIFYPTYANTSVTSLFGDLKGLNAICSALGSSVPSLKSVCQGCAAAKQAENLTSILNWANDKCPRTRSTLLWCGTFLGESQSGNDIAVGTAPYTQCRPAFLDLVRSSAVTLGIGSVIICAGALLVIIFACVLRCRERREAQYEDTTYGAQQATTTPQTNAPYFAGQQQPTDHLYSSKV